MQLWTIDDVLVSDAGGNLIDCPFCPCDEDLAENCIPIDFGIWTTLYNTGVGADRLTLTEGNCEDPVLDDHWDAEGSPAFKNNGFTGLPNGATVGWISLTCDSRNVQGPDYLIVDGLAIPPPPGLGQYTPYTFTHIFTMPGSINFAGLWLLGSVACDDAILDILVNGVSTKSSSASQDGRTFLLGRGWQAGSNTLEFIVGQKWGDGSAPNDGDGELSFGLLVNFICYYDDRDPADGVDELGFH